MEAFKGRILFPRIGRTDAEKRYQKDARSQR